jgi:tRNA threonylcarbamoyladenosine biosynthesis protein TsaB
VEHWLSLDLSSSTASLAIHREPGELLRQVIVGTDFDHSERLLDTLAEALRAAGLDLSAIDRYLTPAGPGSFTGLRIAMATLKAFALVNAKPIEALSSTEARALAWTGGFEKALLVVTHASMGRFIHSRFERAAEGKLALISETILAVGELVEETGITILVDERAREVYPRGHLFPLRASHLGGGRNRVSSRQVFSTLSEWIALSPKYYGDARFS